jgi:hypothetical protein
MHSAASVDVGNKKKRNADENEGDVRKRKGQGYSEGARLACKRAHGTPSPAFFGSTASCNPKKVYKNMHACGEQRRTNSEIQLQRNVRAKASLERTFFGFSLMIKACSDTVKESGNSAPFSSSLRWNAGRPSVSSARSMMNSARVLSPIPTWFSSSVHTCACKTFRNPEFRQKTRPQLSM